VSKFDDADLSGWCNGTIGFIQVRGVDELCSLIVRESIPSVNMTENMYPGLHRLDGMEQQFLASEKRTEVLHFLNCWKIVGKKDVFECFQCP